MSESLKVISIQSQNAADTCCQITEYLGERLGLVTEFVNNVSWQDREQLLDSGQAHLGWICGLPYVRKVAQNPSAFELVAAPVMQPSRYQQRPIYFSDVIVRRDSPYATFADLRGMSWAYNEPNSQSGYNVTRYHLAQLGEKEGYFGEVIEAGSHLGALDMVLEQRIEASAIDSTVLDLAFESRPELRSELRIIETFGPSPIPPWVISMNLPPILREAIRNLFWEMHITGAGRRILSAGQIQRMSRVTDRHYDPIRAMATMADGVVW